MPFPSLIEINTALQNPQIAFKHKELLRGVLTDPDNPIRDSGRYAAISQLRIQDKDFALRIPIAEWENSGPRYRMIEREISNKCSAFVDCKLLSRAMLIPVPTGSFHDVVVMEWVDGVNLSTFVKDAATRDAVHDLEQLRESLQEACAELQGLRISHGDLSPLNVLVLRTPRTNRVSVKLVDYDFVSHPSLSFVTRLPLSPTRHPARPSVSDTSSDLFVFHLYDVVLETLAMKPSIIGQLNDYLDQTLFVSLSDRTTESDQNLELLRGVNAKGISRLEALAVAPYLDTPSCSGVAFDLPADTIPSSDWRSLNKKNGKRVSVFGYVNKQEGELLVLEMPTPNNGFQGVFVSPRRGRQRTPSVTDKPLIAAGTVRQRGGQIFIDDADIADPNDEAIREKLPKGWMRSHIETVRKRIRDKTRRHAHDEEKTLLSGSQFLAERAKPTKPIELSKRSDFPPFDGSAPQRRRFSNPPPMGIDITKRYTATMSTSLGEIIIVLDTAAAPRTVNNFVFLALNHFYDGVIFHRIIKNFVCQGGDPEGSGRGGPGYRIADELPKPNQYMVGSLAMANAGPNTNGSQFFIISGPDGCRLPPQYSLFGQVVKGLDVVEAMQNVPTGAGDRPKTDVLINSITIIAAD